MSVAVTDRPAVWRDAVIAEAMTWLGTPYHPSARLKGIGVDCGQILCAVFEACGLVPPIDLGHYSPEWHLHRGDELYMGWLDRYAQRTAAPRAGDIALYKFGRLYAHGGVVLPDQRVLHAYLGRGVIITADFEEPLAGRPVLYWTLG